MSTKLSSEKENIINSIKRMDVEMLNSFLDDSMTYQEASKDVFLEKIKDVFLRLKDLNDRNLKHYSGKCISKKCNNTGCNGYRFQGNVSKVYLDLIIKESDERIQDIFHCYDFLPDESEVESNYPITIAIGRDEEASFKPSEDYLITFQQAEDAYKELISDEISYLYKEDYYQWLQKHKSLKETIPDDLFSPFKRLDKFVILYNNLHSLKHFLDYIPTVHNAIDDYKNMDSQNEEQLFNWVIKYKTICDDLILSKTDFDDESKIEKGFFKLSYKYKIRIAASDFIPLVDFKSIFNKQFWKVLERYYKTNNIEMDSLTESAVGNYFSLYQHLEKKL